MKLKILLDRGAKVDRAHETDAGLDLFARNNAVIRAGARAIFDTGVHVAIPAGYVGMLTSKSGLMAQGITSRGTIDSGYIGSIHAVLFNHGDKEVIIKKGQKISQLVIMPIVTPELELVTSLDNTERGVGGFGSTGEF
jgi:dUTP pyrophosphatase